MIKAYMNEIKRRVRARFQLRGVRHGVGNYVFGGIRIIERKNFECGSYCRFNDGAYINASNGLKIGNDVTLSANCTILTTGLDYNSWAGGERKHLNGGGYL